MNNPLIRNILAVLAGLFAGTIVNGLIIYFSPHIIPPPEGVNIATMEGLKAVMPQFKPIHFLLPFFAHALGTLFGAFVTCKIAISLHLKLSLLIGCLFLIGGITAVIQIPAPIWFEALDLICAYLPMAAIGYYIDRKK